jgi:hypothetical protein
MEYAPLSSSLGLPSPRGSRIFRGSYPSAGFLVDFEYKQNKGLNEELVKRVVTVHLEGDGYSVKCGEKAQHGPDIEAFHTSRPGLVVEAKGEASRPEMFRNFFQAALGQIILRMNAEGCSYIVALPCHQQFVRLVRQVPQSVSRKLGLEFWLIEPDSGALDYSIHTALGT